MSKRVLMGFAVAAIFAVAVPVSSAQPAVQLEVRAVEPARAWTGTDYTPFEARLVAKQTVPGQHQIRCVAMQHVQGRVGQLFDHALEINGPFRRLRADVAPRSVGHAVTLTCSAVSMVSAAETARLTVELTEPATTIPTVDLEAMTARACPAGICVDLRLARHLPAGFVQATHGSRPALLSIQCHAQGKAQVRLPDPIQSLRIAPAVREVVRGDHLTLTLPAVPWDAVVSCVASDPRHLPPAVRQVELAAPRPQVVADVRIKRVHPRGQPIWRPSCDAAVCARAETIKVDLVNRGREAAGWIGVVCTDRDPAVTFSATVGVADEPLAPGQQRTIELRHSSYAPSPVGETRLALTCQVYDAAGRRLDSKRARVVMAPPRAGP